MNHAEKPQANTERRPPGDRLSRISEAVLRICESLDLDTVLQEVVDSARTLTGSRYGAITTFGGTGQMPEFIVSGLTRQEHQGLWEMPGGSGFFEYLAGLETPLRISDVVGYLSALGMGRFSPPVSASSLLVAPLRHQGAGVGTIYVAHETEGREFSQQDEDTLAMFASQAALVIANARRHREEQRTRERLETLINTSPVGVVVFEATGALSFVNREALRIVEGLREPGQKPEELLAVLSYRARRRARGLAEGLPHRPSAELRRDATGRGDRDPGTRRTAGQHHHQRHIHTLGRRHPRVGGGHTPGPSAHQGPGGAPGRVPGHGEPRTAGAPGLYQRLRRRLPRRPVPTRPRRHPPSAPTHRVADRPDAGPDPGLGRGRPHQRGDAAAHPRTHPHRVPAQTSRGKFLGAREHQPPHYRPTHRRAPGDSGPAADTRGARPPAIQRRPPLPTGRGDHAQRPPRGHPRRSMRSRPRPRHTDHPRTLPQTLPPTRRAPTPDRDRVSRPSRLPGNRGVPRRPHLDRTLQRRPRVARHLHPAGGRGGRPGIGWHRRRRNGQQPSPSAARRTCAGGRARPPSAVAHTQDPDRSGLHPAGHLGPPGHGAAHRDGNGPTSSS